MPKNILSDNFRVAYAVSLVGQLGFYIAIPFLIAILSGDRLDQIILPVYGEHNEDLHNIFTFGLTIAAGIFCVWQIRKLILPLIYDDEYLKEKSAGIKK